LDIVFWIRSTLDGHNRKARLNFYLLVHSFILLSVLSFFLSFFGGFSIKRGGHWHPCSPSENLQFLIMSCFDGLTAMISACQSASEIAEDLGTPQQIILLI